MINKNTMNDVQCAVRKNKRFRRSRITEQDRTILSEKISQVFLQTHFYQTAKRIAIYLPFPEEVNTHLIIKTAWKENKLIYLPVVLSKEKAMLFAPYLPGTSLVKDAMFIDVPNVKKEAYIDSSGLDIVVVPLVAFDKYCHRVGMGGGFYDRTFEFKRTKPFSAPMLVGVAFESQRVEKGITPHSWDVPLDYVVSENCVYKNDRET